ncbi:MAG: MarR family transcriptional regulator [Candidatus Heimdallarchaeota archaeon]
MLSKVLEYLRAGGNANTATIARKLGIEEGTVVLLLDQLVKLGYLERIDDFKKEATFCEELKCTGCPRLSRCKPILLAKYKLIKK